MEYLFKSVTMYNQYIKFRIPCLSSEIYLIKWLPNSETIYHGHKGKQCNFVLLKGNELYEKRKTNANANESLTILKPFHIYSINDTIGIHKIINNDNKIKWSLHRYL
jgi:hypothetical protein